MLGRGGSEQRLGLVLERLNAVWRLGRRFRRGRGIYLMGVLVYIISGDNGRRYTLNRMRRCFFLSIPVGFLLSVCSLPSFFFFLLLTFDFSNSLVVVVDGYTGDLFCLILAHYELVDMLL